MLAGLRSGDGPLPRAYGLVGPRNTVGDTRASLPFVPRSSAQRRHGVITGQHWHMRLAASMSVRDAPEVLTGKNRSVSRPLQAA